MDIGGTVFAQTGFHSNYPEIKTPVARPVYLPLDMAFSFQLLLIIIDLGYVGYGTF